MFALDAEMREAIQHAQQVHTEGSCQWPRARVIPVRDVYPSPSTTYIPHCAILHRCSDDTGCCRSEAFTCVPKHSHRVELFFYVSPAISFPLFYYTRCSLLFLRFLYTAKFNEIKSRLSCSHLPIDMSYIKKKIINKEKIEIRINNAINIIEESQIDLRQIFPYPFWSRNSVCLIEVMRIRIISTDCCDA